MLCRVVSSDRSCIATVHDPSMCTNVRANHPTLVSRHVPPNQVHCWPTERCLFECWCLFERDIFERFSYDMNNRCDSCDLSCKTAMIEILALRARTQLLRLKFSRFALEHNARTDSNRLELTVMLMMMIESRTHTTKIILLHDFRITHQRNLKSCE